MVNFSCFHPLYDFCISILFRSSLFFFFLDCSYSSRSVTSIDLRRVYDNHVSSESITSVDEWVNAPDDAFDADISSSDGDYLILFFTRFTTLSFIFNSFLFLVDVAVDHESVSCFEPDIGSSHDIYVRVYVALTSFVADQEYGLLLDEFSNPVIEFIN